MFAARTLLLIPLLAACAANRDAGGSGASPPALVPLGLVLADGDRLAAAAATEATAAEAVSTSAGALAAQTMVLAPMAVADDPARAAALADRAEALRAPVLTPAERARLASLQ